LNAEAVSPNQAHGRGYEFDGLVFFQCSLQGFDQMPDFLAGACCV